MSLIQVLVFGGVLSALALVGTSMINDQKAAQKGAQTQDDITILHQAVTNILQDKKYCSATLLYNASMLSSGWNTPTSTPADIEAVYLAQTTAPNTQTGQPFIKKAANAQMNPRYMNGNIFISSIRVNFPLNRFEIDYNRVNNKAYVAKSVTKFVENIIFKTEAGVNTCFASQEDVNLNLNQKFCTSLGTLFTWANNNCVLADKNCSADEVLTGIDAGGNKVCQPVATYLDWATLVDSTVSCNPSQTPATRVYLEVVGGKIRVRCTN